ncbi:hypothetical protein [Streptomyces sp. SAS_260]|uniref:hypothetical protein n=1 Tax=Streptomyces sp. SAS_260 TaxID=3412751 RepID=UPI00403D52CB
MLIARTDGYVFGSGDDREMRRMVHGASSSDLILVAVQGWSGELFLRVVYDLALLRRQMGLPNQTAPGTPNARRQTGRQQTYDASALAAWQTRDGVGAAACIWFTRQRHAYVRSVYLLSGDAAGPHPTEDDLVIILPAPEVSSTGSPRRVDDVAQMLAISRQEQSLPPLPRW